MRKIAVLILVLVLVIGLTVGCGAAATTTTAATTKAAPAATTAAPTTAAATTTAAKQYKFAFAVKNQTNPFFISMATGMKDACAKIGATLNVQATEKETDIDKQIQMLQTFLTQKYDAIFVTPLSSTAIVPFIKECNDAKVPIIVVDTRADETELKKIGAKMSYFVAGDNENAGLLAAKAMVEALSNKGDIAILDGAAGAASGVAIRKGMLAGLEGSGINVKVSQAADWNRNKAFDVTQTILIANPKLNAILAANDEMALGAVRAVKESGLSIKVIGINNAPDAQTAVKAGEMYATVDKASYEQGTTAIAKAVELLSGKTLASVEDYLKCKVIKAADLK